MSLLYGRSLILGTLVVLTGCSLGSLPEHLPASSNNGASDATNNGMEDATNNGMVDAGNNDNEETTNNAPSVVDVRVAPAYATVEQRRFECAWTFSDPEQDEDQSSVTWKVTRGEDVLLEEESRALELPDVVVLASADVVTCLVTPSDGNSQGEPSSGEVEIFDPPMGVRDLEGVPVWFGEDSDDESGFKVAIGNVDDDVYADVLVASRGQGGGAVYLIFGGETLRGPLETSLSEAAVKIEGVEESPIGLSVASGGDVDGDGLDDVLIGSAQGPDQRCAAYLFLGSHLSELRGESRTDLELQQAAVCLEAEGEYDFAGISLTFAGDVDGGGKDDILVGAPAYGDAQGDLRRGRAYLVYGEELVFDDVQTRVSLTNTVKLQTMWDVDSVGVSLAAVGDINGDEKSDFLIGAPTATANGQVQSGNSFLVLGGDKMEPGEYSLTELAEHVFLGDGRGTLSGSFLSAVDDMDLDGRPEILIGSSYESVQGANEESFSGLFLSSALDVGQKELSLQEASLRVSRYVGDLFGGPLISLGDMDGDDRGDFAMSSFLRENDGKSEAGSVFIFYSHTERELVEGESGLDAADLTFKSQQSGAEFGRSMGAGDLDGDGVPDLVVGAPEFNCPGDSSPCGGIYLLFGSR